MITIEKSKRKGKCKMCLKLMRMGRDNIVRACLGCNSSKGTKDVWCKSKGISIPKCIIQNLKKLGEKNG